VARCSFDTMDTKIPESSLNDAERKVLDAFRAGEQEVSVKSECPGESEVRGEFLRGLFLGGYDKEADYRGTIIAGANISDVLDMGFCETTFPVRFHDCCFAKEIKIRQLACPGLDFRGCTLKEGLDAPRAKTAGGVSLHNGFKAEGQVSLAGAVIGGQLVCSDGSFQSKKEEEKALYAQGIKVADVFLDKGFKAEGQVSLAGAEVKGQLNCWGGNFQIQNKEWSALNARNIKVAEDVLLSDEFNAAGAVSLDGVDIGGNLVLKKCKLTHLSLAGANVSGEFQDDAGVYKDNQGGSLDIDGFRYRRLDAVKERVKDRLAWVGLMSKGGEFYPQPYKQLMQVYRAAGHMNEARDVGFALENKCQEAMRSWLWKHWYSVLRLTVGYGYKPFRFLGWFFGIILGGGLLFSGGLEVIGLAVMVISCLAVGMFEKTPKLMWIGLLGFILCVSSAMVPCAKWGSAESFWEHIPTVFTGVTDWDGCRAWRMHPTHAKVFHLENGQPREIQRLENYPRLIPLLYAAETAFPLFPLGQTDNWHPATWWVKFIQWIISILGTVSLAILALCGAGLLGPRWRDE